jgi:tellurite resistance protein
LTGAVDPFARVLYFFALFLCLLLFMQAGLFRTLRFYLSWWAYSFPLAALSIASFLMFAQTGYPALCAIAVGVWCILAVLICILCFRTLHAIRRRDICVEE